MTASTKAAGQFPKSAGQAPLLQSAQLLMQGLHITQQAHLASLMASQIASRARVCTSMADGMSEQSRARACTTASMAPPRYWYCFLNPALNLACLA